MAEGDIVGHSQQSSVTGAAAAVDTATSSHSGTSTTTANATTVPRKKGKKG